MYINMLMKMNKYIFFLITNVVERYNINLFILIILQLSYNHEYV